MGSLYDLLKGNDLRSIGKADEVAELVEKDPDLFEELFNGIFLDDKIVCARSADAVEKVARKNPSLIQKKKSALLKNLDKFNQKEVVWHIALLIGYLNLNNKEFEKATNQLTKWLTSSHSIIVKVACMQSLAEQALKNKILIKSARDEINMQMMYGSPAVKARGRKLLKMLSKS